ncbi:hypothetical protein RN001_006735 [Aquatica leii]|uniref:Major facilitator superfamily (MFS) profile domain-containing protein n=1 Tax=Aquatica leii TaxID=1421715 RepID=A0AAN7PLF7_9COLE|nr:hypothetical protein RN001_006735 [Aquatica leii]
MISATTSKTENEIDTVGPTPETLEIVKTAVYATKKPQQRKLSLTKNNGGCKIMTEDLNVLDSILVEVGEFGRYQRRVCFFILIAAAFIYFSFIIFVFETKQVRHRCKINECDVEPMVFKPQWWANAAPSDFDELSMCIKYQHINNSNIHSCESKNFDCNVKVACDTYVYETSEISIQHDVSIFMDLFIRFGRKTLLVWGMVLSAIIGLSRSFANSYILFIILEYLEAFCISGSFATLWILGVEYVGPKKRIFVTVLINSFAALGGITQTLIAWQVQSWRVLLQIVYSLQLIMIFYYWLIPESARWLLTKGRFGEIKHMLEHIAETNKKTISEESFKKLENFVATKEDTKTIPIIEFFHSRILIVRLIICASCWACCIFLCYGFIINAVQLSANSYLDLILIILVDIPGCMTYTIADRIGRRLSLAGGFLIAGLSCFGYIFINIDQRWLQLIVYLLGKFGVAISFSALYTASTEIFPTPFRNTLLSICAMVGGIGAVSAPQLPLLKTIWEYLPFMLFGCIGLGATVISLFLPETMNLELPNTVKEAEAIGRFKSNKINVV